jgi:hypothetical protein
VDELLSLAPAGLREALAERGAQIESSWSDRERRYLVAGELFARYSLDEGDVAVFEHEARVRSLVGEQGSLRSPAVLAQGRGWLLERRIVPGDDSVDAVIAAAGELLRLELPPPPEAPAAGGALQRRLRLLGQPWLVPHLLRAKRLLAGSRLPLATAHGDFHPDNVLRAEGAAWVVDWELVRRAPVGFDLMRYRASLSDPAERAQVDAGALELAGDERELARLRYAVAAVTASDMLGHPQAFHRDRARGKELLGELPELEANL